MELVFVFFVFSLCSLSSGLELKPKCGFPGKPFKAKLNPEKSWYSDGEVVAYDCNDYWAAPQTRKCINGEWVGPVARCGTFMGEDLLMKDVQVFDMSYAVPKEMFHYTNMNITKTKWKYPNAFTSNRFKAARLAIQNDHEYLWQFNFTRPATKLYVKVNFHFLRINLLPEAVQKSHEFSVSVDISPYRTCELQYQERVEWRQNGSRVDSFFICETDSNEASILDAADPPNRMSMRTKSSLNITHEFVALFFGKVFGTDEEPLCGEPSTRFGESFRANQENRDYMIGCEDKENWYDANTGSKRRFNYNQRCIGDMHWNVTRPNCLPKKFCPITGALAKRLRNVTSIDMQSPGSTSGKSDPNLVVESILNYFQPHDSPQTFMTVGSEVTYSCISDDYLLVGKEVRKCNSDFRWNGHEPVCKSIRSDGGSRNMLMIVIAVMGFFLLLTLTICGILYFICTKRLKVKMAKAEAEKAAMAANGWQSSGGDIGFYDNIEMNGKIIDDDGVYEIYEHIDDPIGNEYTSYLDAHAAPSYDAISPIGAMGMHNPPGHPRFKVPLQMAGAEDDYVRMLRDNARYEHLVSGGNNPFRGDSFKRRDAEPSYLEIHR